jgi:hypothetical protein
MVPRSSLAPAEVSLEPSGIYETKSAGSPYITLKNRPFFEGSGRPVRESPRPSSRWHEAAWEKDRTPHKARTHTFTAFVGVPRHLQRKNRLSSFFVSRDERRKRVFVTSFVSPPIRGRRKTETPSQTRRAYRPGLNEGGWGRTRTVLEPSTRPQACARDRNKTPFSEGGGVEPWAA